MKDIKDRVGIAARKIIYLIRDNAGLLTKDENLPALAYMFWKWDRLQHSGRYLPDTITGFEGENGYIDYTKMTDADHAKYETNHDMGSDSCENNPKYEVQDHIINEISDEITGNLIYDAWAVSVANEDYGGECYGDYYDDNNTRIKVYDTLNMTLEDWKEYASFFRHLSSNDFYLRSWLLLACGTGIKLDKDGYPANVEPSGIPTAMFSGWADMKGKLPIEVADEFNRLINLPECKESINVAYKTGLRLDEERSNERKLGQLLLCTNVLERMMKSDPDAKIMGMTISELLNKDDLTIVNTVHAYMTEIKNAKTDEELEAERVEQEARSAEYDATHPKETPRHVSFCKEYSLMSQYKKFAPCYKPHLIQTAKELIEQEPDYSHCKTDENKKYATDNFNKMKDIAIELLDYFGISND